MTVFLICIAMAHGSLDAFAKNIGYSMKMKEMEITQSQMPKNAINNVNSCEENKEFTPLVDDKNPSFIILVNYVVQSIQLEYPNLKFKSVVTNQKPNHTIFAFNITKCRLSIPKASALDSIEFSATQPYVISLVIAHEYGHLLQCVEQTKYCLSSTPNQYDLSLAETQADIIGGYFLRRYFWDSAFEKQLRDANLLGDKKKRCDVDYFPLPDNNTWIESWRDGFLIEPKLKIGAMPSVKTVDLAIGCEAIAAKKDKNFLIRVLRNIVDFVGIESSSIHGTFDQRQKAFRYGFSLGEKRLDVHTLLQDSLRQANVIRGI
jgi:hypothetical protein